MHLDRRVAAPVLELELLVECNYKSCSTLSESSTAIPSVFDLLSELQVTAETV